MSQNTITSRLHTSRPVLRTVEHTQQQPDRKATRLDLYFDLFFVAIIGLISHSFADSLSTSRSRPIFFQLLIHISAVWRLWTSVTYFFERYITKWLTKRIFMFIQMFLIAGIALTIHGWLMEMGSVFFLLYGVAKWLLAVLYIRANTGHKDPTYCKNNLLQVRGNMSVLCAALLGTLLPPQRRGILFLISLVIDICIPIVGKSTMRNLPDLQLHIYNERFWLFMIIVLWEAILSVITGIDTEHITPLVLSLWTAALMISFWHRRLYFDYVSKAKMIPKYIYSRTYLHLPLTLCYTMVGASIFVMIEHETTVNSLSMNLLIVSCSIIMLIIARFESITGNYYDRIAKRTKDILPLIVSSLSMLLLLIDRDISSVMTIRILVWCIFFPIISRVVYLISQRKQFLQQEEAEKVQQ